LIVADRFVVKVEGTGLSAEELKGALASVDRKRLESMKNVGVVQAPR
jgi:hypothetical protein